MWGNGLTKWLAFGSIKTTNEQRSTWKIETNTNGQARRIIYPQCRTMYRARLQLRHNKNTTFARPAQKLAFLIGAWTWQKLMSSQNPNGGSEQSDAQEMEAVATNGIHQHKHNRAKLEKDKKHETKSTNTCHNRRTNRSHATGREDRQRLRGQEHATRSLQLDHNSRWRKQVFIKKRTKEKKWQEHTKVGRELEKRIARNTVQTSTQRLVAKAG